MKKFFLNLLGIQQPFTVNHNTNTLHTALSISDARNEKLKVLFETASEKLNGKPMSYVFEELQNMKLPKNEEYLMVAQFIRFMECD